MRKIRIIVAGVIIGCIATTYCTYAEETESLEIAAETEIETEASAEDFVKLGDYKNLTLTVSPQRKITDKDVEDEIRLQLQLCGVYDETDKKTVEEGDIVNIDYKGKIDGKEFDGGSAEGFHLMIGSNSFIDGFEEQLIGCKTGETVKIKVTFPDTYYREFAGKNAEFEVKINSIEKEGTLSDKNVDLVSGGTAKTAKEFRKQVKQRLEEEAEKNRKTSLHKEVLTRLAGISEIKSFPEDEIRNCIDAEMKKYEEYATGAGQTVEEFFKNSYGMTKDEMEQNIRAGIEDSLEEEMLLDAVADKEDIKISDEELMKAAEEYAKETGRGSADQVFEEFGKEEFRKQARRDAATDFIAGHAQVIEAAENTATYSDFFSGFGGETETVADETETELP